MNSPQILRATATTPSDSSRALRRAAAADVVVRIGPGAYVDRTAWSRLDRAEQHRLRIRASPEVDGGRGRGLVVSHRSAVALLGLPWIGDFGDRVYLLDPERDRGQCNVRSVRVGAAGRAVRSLVVDGTAVTDHVATAVDVALREHPWRAAAVVDAARNAGVARDELFAELERRGRVRASRRAADVIDFSEVGSESAGESIARWAARTVGAPRPLLQQAFSDDTGFVGRVDLWFPAEGTVVEFDGLVKYRQPEPGRSAAEVVVAEKRREDRLRRCRGVDGVARVTWADAMPGGQLPRILADAGVPIADDWTTRWRAAARRTW